MTRARERIRQPRVVSNIMGLLPAGMLVLHPTPSRIIVQTNRANKGWLPLCPREP